MKYQYDRTDKVSIWRYSAKLLETTLSSAIYPNQIDEEIGGKGKLGQLVEKYFFGYDLNSNPDADFSDAGLELKCTPLRELKNHKLSIKERLVCNMINYSEAHSVPFKNSHFYLKCLYMLILFYLHNSEAKTEDLIFLYSVLWKIPEKDLIIIEQDYNVIVSKIRDGKAHELSEGDTMYLGACRKGQKGDSEQSYTLPDGSVAEQTAPKRAFSLKPAYMRTILAFAEEEKERLCTNIDGINQNEMSELINSDELRHKSFDEILLGRISPYYGKGQKELCNMFGANPLAKQCFFQIANAILTEQKRRGESVDDSEEIKKSGIVFKTIRVEENGSIRESMSFKNIDYQEVLLEDEWLDSTVYELFSSKFLFVVFRKVGGEYKLNKAFFWTMPQSDLDDAYYYWQNIKTNVEKNQIDAKYFYRHGEHKKFHVRTKGKVAAQKAINPHGGFATKYCYWFNNEYVKSIIEQNE